MVVPRLLHGSGTRGGSGDDDGRTSSTPPSSVSSDSLPPSLCLPSASSIACPSGAKSPGLNTSQACVQGAQKESIAEMLLDLRGHLDRIIVAICASNNE
ncbi:hypothetical protein IAQ61_004954 [Plenodomus lingam]|uniref:Predicted protein n=1 Tax=Leptosphaeria maculans (strain JN3 / isolate v23.1.3 / race Av1-4-5-6-7-8) TaxID=985895 RepID=E4ZT95_LEPMJ|nr:predicted protein [Plenodomus lingam JN3]KAH9872554.1 hypothetical protein IAQ61_004954 [Plenodomus lingam]CBX90037.1 predicted protein [Plenodomus lingam JN3]